MTLCEYITEYIICTEKTLVLHTVNHLCEVYDLYWDEIKKTILDGEIAGINCAVIVILCAEMPVSLHTYL